MSKHYTFFQDQSAWESGSKDYPNVSLLSDGSVLYQPTRPPYSGKALLTYNDGTEYEIVCNTSSTLSEGEVTGRSGYNKDSITQAVIGVCTTDIGYGAFYNCSGLTSIDIPNSVTSISGFAFQNCSNLTSVTIPSSVTSIGYAAFSKCIGLQNIEVYSSSIGEIEFDGCSGLTSVTLSNNLSRIGARAFTGCKSLTSITIPSSVTFMDYGVFEDNPNLLNITFEEGSQLTAIPRDLCYHSSGLTSINFPNTITSIGNDSFNGCSGLTSIEIPSGVTSIGTYAFENCYNLETVTIYATTPPTIGSNTFKNIKNNVVIYVPAASVDAYKSATNWRSYASRIQAIPNS